MEKLKRYTAYRRAEGTTVFYVDLTDEEYKAVKKFIEAASRIFYTKKNIQEIFISLMILCRYAETGRRGGFKIRCHNDVWVRVPLPAPYNHSQ